MKRRIVLVFFWCWIYGLTSSAWAQREGLPPQVVAFPDMVLYNGKIVTMDDRSTNPVPGTIVRALAIRDGKILATGNDQEILALAGPKTQRIDLEGRTVIPGLIDTHSHLHDYALRHWGRVAGIKQPIAVRGETLDQFLDGIKKGIEKARGEIKADEWIEFQLPREALPFIREGEISRKILDEHAPDHPVLVACGTTALVNGKAIEVVENFYRSSIVEDALDKQTGVATFGTEFIRAVPAEVQLKGRIEPLVEVIRKELEEWAAFGITTFSSHINVPSHVNVYAELSRRGQMPIRFAWTHRSGTLFNPEASGFYRRVGDMAGVGTDYLWNIGVTVGHLDQSYPGVCTSISARPEIKKRELCVGEPGMFKRGVMLDMVRSGLRITGTHIAGDRALDNFLEIIKEGSAMAGIGLEGIRAKQHVIDHCTLSPRPEQHEELKRLGITMSCGPKYIPNSERVLRDYGERYISWVVPAKSLIESGVKTVWEIDDHEVAEKGAFHYLELLVARKVDGKVWAPQERVDRTIALKMATTWASEYILREQVLGTLEPGKWADLLVLNRDYFSVAEDEIHAVRPLMTVVGGRIAYLDKTFAEKIKAEPLGIQPRFSN